VWQPPAQCSPPLPRGQTARCRSFYSADGRFAAYSGLAPDLTTAVDAKTGRKLWSIPRWFRGGALANDGAHFIAMPMLQFFESGQLIGTVKLGDLISQDESMRFPTVSHRCMQSRDRSSCLGRSRWFWPLRSSPR
jgi:hypothetical protein